MTNRRIALLAVFAAFVISTLGRLTQVALGLNGSLGILLLDIGSYLAPIAVAVVLGSLLSLRIRGSLEHRFWGMLTIASAFLLAGEAYWSWYAYAVDPLGPTPVSFSNVMSALAALSFMSLLVLMTPFRRKPLHRRLVFYADALIAQVFAFSFLYWFWTLPLVRPVSANPVSDAVIAALYPVLGGVMLFAVVSLVVGWKAYPWRPWEVGAAAGVAVFGLGVAAFPLWFSATAGQATGSSSWYLMALGAAYYLLLLSMVDRLSRLSAGGCIEPWPTPDVPVGWAWHVVPVLGVFALVWVGSLTRSVSGEPEAVPLYAATVSLGALLAVRSMLAAADRYVHRREAQLDASTGVSSFSHFEQALSALLVEASASGDSVGVLVIDVCGLNELNLKRGHMEGDRVLRDVARVVGEHLPDGALIGRLGDDDFGVFAAGLGVDETAELARTSWRAVHRMKDSLGGVEVAIGAAVSALHGTSSHALLAAAAEAERLARGAEGEAWELYDPERLEQMDDHTLLERARLRSMRATVRTLAEAVDARDAATRNHSTGVSELATALAQVVGLSDEEVQTIGLAALLHDVGKIGIKDEVLLKVGPLEHDERTAVEEHAALGERILRPAGLDAILPLVRHHHERWDGRGYPDGLTGAEIPLGARILALCDTFETITTGRPYRGARDGESALREIERGSGRQFDPHLSAVFCRMVRRLHAPATPAVARSVHTGESALTEGAGA